MESGAQMLYRRTRERLQKDGAGGDPPWSEGTTVQDVVTGSGSSDMHVATIDPAARIAR